MDGTLFIALTAISAILATLLLYAFVFPEQKKARLNRFFKKVRKLLSFEYLLIEKVLRFIYVLMTMACVFGGFWALFRLFWVGRDAYYYHNEWLGYGGIPIMVLGPIVVRILYESFMMFIMLVKNTIDIRNHLVGGDKGKAPRRRAPRPSLTKKQTFETAEPDDSLEQDEDDEQEQNTKKNENTEKEDFFM